MIHLNFHPAQVRIDTTITLIEQDGTEVKVPVVVLVGVNNINSKQQANIYKIAHTLFNKDFTLDRRLKLQSKKPWYKFW